IGPGRVPVVAPLALSTENEALNVDGDRVAARIAAAIDADALLILTNVPGLLRDVNDPDSLVAETTIAEAEGLAQGRMKKKVFALELAIRAMDLTTLEGADTPGKVAALATKGVRPDPTDPSIPSVAAICVYPNLVPTALARTKGTGVKVASVATAFPSGQSSIEVKLEETREVVAMGAHEVDMVIDRGAFLSGRYAQVYDEIVRVKEICAGKAHLKVIIETGELGT